MKIIEISDIKGLGISPATCVEWVRESFMVKNRAQLPAKNTIHPQGDDFFNTMPCLLPPEYGRFGVKEVHRIAGAVPALGSDFLLYDSSNGELLAFMDADWITAMRTGAVAALAAKTFRKTDASVYSFIGLGNTARASLLCLLDSEPDLMHKVLLKRYKDQAELFIERFKDFRNVIFEIYDSTEEMIRESDVVFSCITAADGLICEDMDCFRPGILLIPVHTRGFQNCDTVFDKIYADDTAHVCGFRYFNSFRRFAELSDVLSGNAEGRFDDRERIISYNIGLGLHDLIFADKIYALLKDRLPDLPMNRETAKFWI